MIAPNAAFRINDLPPGRSHATVPPSILALEAFLADVMGADAAEVARALTVTKAAATRILQRAYALGLIARVDRGYYSVHVRHAREARIP